jgi:hypothetical protein
VVARPNKPQSTAVVAGIVAGALDITYAWLFWALEANVAFQRILQSVASGLLGPASFDGGARTALLGFVLHFAIAIVMSVLYFLAAGRVAILWQRPLLCGALYGLLLYGVMHYVVVPLSAAAGGSADPLWTVLTIAVHMLLVGVPIALFAKRSFRSVPAVQGRKVL